FNTSVTDSKECDIFDGNWVNVHFFHCLGNGRGHEEYLKWRWKPKHCHVPRFQVRDVLERLRSKRIVFVGDSLSRTQWESLICMFIMGLDDKSSVYEVFLVQHGRLHWHAPKRVKSTLKCYQPGVELSGLSYFQYWSMVGNSLRLGMSIPAAYRVALKTWASWIMTTIDPNKTHVLIRTIQPQTLKERDRSIFSEMTKEVVKNMTVTVLDVTSMSPIRSDGHVGLWSDNPLVPDCSHWCVYLEFPISGMKSCSSSSLDNKYNNLTLFRGT
ncbi:hypothetical protein HID58_069612, partial [Brassica napus]